MVQRIIDIFPATMPTVDSANFQLKICLEPLAISLLLQSTNLDLQAAEYFSWSPNDGENVLDIVIFLKQNSKLFNLDKLPTIVYFRTENVLFLPRELAINAEQFLQVQFGLKTGEGFLQRSINEEISVAWKINLVWAEVFTNQFPGHTCQSNINNLFLVTSFNAPDSIYLSFGNGLVEVIAIFGQKLQLAKCFVYNTINDLEHYLLNICRQLKVKSTEVSIKLQGFIAPDSTLYRALQTYFSNVETINADTANWHETLKALPAHYFTGLIQAK